MTLGRRVLSPTLGRTRFQPLYERLHEASLAGLNLGEGNDPVRSGERLVVERLAKSLARAHSPVTVFDVGANTGSYLGQLVESFGHGTRILAFEPALGAFQALQAAYGSRAAVDLHNFGFSDRERSAQLHAPGARSKLASLHDISARLERGGMAATRPETVTLTTIDRFCAAQSIERIDFLKLDIEGHELSALLGARGMLDAGRIEAIQFEFGVANLDSRTYFRDFHDLLGARYALYRVLQDGLEPIAHYKETYEVFKRATNYLALRTPESLEAP